MTLLEIAIERYGLHGSQTNKVRNEANYRSAHVGHRYAYSLTYS